MQIEVVQCYSVALLREEPDKVFVFGDNLVRAGRGGQAVIRCEPNAFGVPTKRLPSMREDAFFGDRDDERAAVLDSLRRLYALGRGCVIVFPAAGLGTGLAQMPSRSPRLYKEMTHLLEAHFGFRQEAL